MWQKLRTWLQGPPGRRELRAHLRALAGPDYPDHRLVVQSGMSRLWIRLPPETPGLVLLRDFLLELEPVAAQRAAQTALNLGYQAHAEGDYVYAERLSQHGHLISKVEQTLAQVLGHQRKSIYSVSLEPDRSPRNQELLRTMRVLARQRDDLSRQQVYQTLAASTLLLPLQKMPEEGAALSVAEDHEPLGGRSVWCVFTDVSRLAQWRNPASPYLRVPGIRLVRAALQKNLGSVRINPGSDVGGELYRNELQRMGEAWRLVAPGG